MTASFRNFDYEMRGHPRRCASCGAPLLLSSIIFGRTRCRPCQDMLMRLTNRLDEDNARLKERLADVEPLPDGELDRPIELPPMEPLPQLPPLREELRDPVIQELLSGGALQFLASIDDHPEDYDTAPSLAATQDRAVRGHTEGTLPSGFRLESGCDICCLIMNENVAAPVPVRPTRLGYRCAAHSDERARAILRKWGLDGGR